MDGKVHFKKHFYPRPPQGGRPSRDVDGQRVIGISIHALRKEGDSPACIRAVMYANFYPRPPQGGRHCKFFRPRRRLSYFYPRPPQGGRLALPLHRKGVRIFLSTPSARRATGKLEAMSVDPDNFYPRPPQGGRLVFIEPVDDLLPISIHALRKEGDRPTFCSNWASTRFLSTPSARRATFFGTLPRSSHRHFYPRPPQGGRQATAHGL